MTGSDDGIPNEGYILFSFGVGEKEGRAKQCPREHPKGRFCLDCHYSSLGVFQSLTEEFRVKGSSSCLNPPSPLSYPGI